MKKTCKKIILTNSLKDVNNLNYSMDFYVFNYKDLTLKNVDQPLLKLSKKGHLHYMLPGSFDLPVKHYFPNHTFIQYGKITDNLMVSLISDKKVILFKYNNSIFFNDSKVLKILKNSEYVETLDISTQYSTQFLLCLSFFL